MNISLNWLRDYIDFPYTIEELAHKLTMIGLEVEEITHQAEPFSGIIVGHIREVVKHPNADRLHVCEVDTGSEVLTVVCGAPNVAPDQLAPFAPVGAVIGDTELSSVTLRGVTSHGMICSERELGISDSHKGIMVLDPAEYTVGQPFISGANAGNDTVFTVNVTPNRPDCLSHIGVAREIAAVTGNKIKIPPVDVSECDTPVEDMITIAIEDPDACPRYCARVVKNVSIKESPAWLKDRLEAVGVRSINNVVDVTNYVLLETGHPLHAFDYSNIAGARIIVRKAAENEEFVTLDNNTRKLNTEDLLICDNDRPVALAGVMGGLNSEVEDSTRDILLESAYFDPMTVRITSKRLNLSTEASYRFERGTDPENTVFAVNRAACLLEQLADGTVCRGIYDNNPKPIKPWEVQVRVNRVCSVLGTEISKDQIVGIFENLGLCVKEDKDRLKVTIPTFRTDLTREIDLIEEVIRMYGFDTIKPSTRSSIVLKNISNPGIDFQEKLRDTLSGIGFNEIITTSMVSEKHVRITDKSGEIASLPVKNPLSPDTAFMRTSLIPGLLDTVKWNHNRSTSDVHLYETGKVFYAREHSLPEEPNLVAGAVTGRTIDTVSWRNRASNVDFYYIKGIVDYLLAKFHINGYSVNNAGHAFFQSELCQSVVLNKHQLGYIGKISKEIQSMWGIECDVFAFVLNIDSLFEVSKERVIYNHIPKFPGVKRDIAVVVSDDIVAGDVENAIMSKGGKYLKNVNLFDLYTGKQIPAGEKSMAFSLTFRNDERTLREQEIDPFFKKIITHLEKTFSASLRSV